MYLTVLAVKLEFLYSKIPKSNIRRRTNFVRLRGLLEMQNFIKKIKK